MIHPVCDKCRQELTSFGALLFSPPDGNHVTKFHLCVECYARIMQGWQKD